MGELYQLYFPQSQKSYIGITTLTAQERFSGHKYSATHYDRGNFPVYLAWRKYGEPKLRVLAVLENDALYKAERKAIAIMNTIAPHGYNLSPGGEFPPMLIPGAAQKAGETRRGTKQSPECIAKRVEKLRGLKRSEETKRRIWDNKSDEGKARSIANLAMGRAVLTAEGLERLRIFNTGKKLNDETKKKIGDAFRGKKQSSEHIEKLRRAKTGKRCSEATKQKLRDANLGKKQSPEIIEKRSRAMKAVWAAKKARGE